jgi:hypothetical protein
VETKSAQPPIVTGAGPPWFRRARAVAAAVYLGGILLNVAGAPLEKVLPRPALYFMQIARLFPNALDATIEYRAEAYRCDDQRWAELDVRPYFPLHPDDKESRFDRAMFFYRRSQSVMKALDDYLVGVMLLSLRIPVPPPGEAVEPYRRKPLADYPAAERKYWYRTAHEDTDARCDEEAKRREPGQP